MKDRIVFYSLLVIIMCLLASGIIYLCSVYDKQLPAEQRMVSSDIGPNVQKMIDTAMRRD
jgi:hypothetical protein